MYRTTILLRNKQSQISRPELSRRGDYVWKFGPVSKLGKDNGKNHDPNAAWWIQGRLILTTQAQQQTSGDPSGLTWNYRSITLLYNFTTALLYKVLSVTIARIVAWLLDIY